VPSFAGLTKFFGRTASEAAAFAAGLAVSPALLPLIQALENETWSAYPDKPPSAATMAIGVAQGQVDPKKAAKWAKQTGYGQDVFDALVNVANVGPGVAAAFELWRRGELDEAGFRRALLRAGLEKEWIDALWKVRLAVLDPADLARAIHRGLVPDPGLLQGQLPARQGNVPAYPVYEIPVLDEALAGGYDKDHLGVLVGLQGNPMGAHEAAQAEFRGVLTRDDFLRAISEGNTRNEWADAIYEQSRQIITAHDWVELALRGYITLDQMYAGTATHGMTKDDSDRLFRVLGRPLTVHQITTALARGAKFNPLEGELTDPYEASVHESNIKPSYYEMAIANKYSYPSLFQLSGLVKANAIDAATAEDWARKTGLAPEVVTALGKFWRSEAPAAKATTTRSATTRATTAVSKAYIATRTSRTQAEAELTKLGVPAAEFDGLFNAWDVNREATIAAMTNTQIRNAFRNLTITESDALARLEARGLSAVDATVYLTAKPGT
jgi:hypothetical protein